MRYDVPQFQHLLWKVSLLARVFERMILMRVLKQAKDNKDLELPNLIA